MFIFQMYLQGPFANLLVTQTYIDLEIKSNNATLCTMVRRFRIKGRRYSTSNLKAWSMWFLKTVHFCTGLTCTKLGAFGRETRLSCKRLLPPAYARCHRLCRPHSIMALWLALDEKIAFEILEFQKSQFSIKRLLPQSSFHIDSSQMAQDIAKTLGHRSGMALRRSKVPFLRDKRLNEPTSQNLHF
jgi:hypothetical protein